MAVRSEEPSTDRPRVALIIPTLEEEDSIGPTIAEVPRAWVDRIIVADGGSRDRTAERAGAAGAEVLLPGRGFGRACLEAARHVTDCAILVFMDGDGADDPAALPDVVGPIARGEADFVMASRTSGRREPGSMAWHQVVAGWGAGLGMRVLYGVRFTDMCTFRAIRRDVLLGLGMTEMTYGWNIEMQMRAARARLRIREIPVRYRVRRGGVSKVAGNLKTSLRVAVRLVSTFLRVAAQPAPATLDRKA